MDGKQEYIILNKDYTPGPYKIIASEEELSPIKHKRRKLKL